MNLPDSDDISSIFYNYDFIGHTTAPTPVFKKEISDDSELKLIKPTFILDFASSKLPQKQFKSYAGYKKALFEDLAQIVSRK